MNISDTPQIIELAQLLAKKHNTTVSETLLAMQNTILANLVEVVHPKEFGCGQAD